MKAANGFRRVQGPLDYGSRTWLKVLFAAIFFVLYAPIVTLIAFSFNTDKRGIVWRGFTFDNYVKAWNNDSLIEALTNSLVIGVASTALCVAFGSMAAYALARVQYQPKFGNIAMFVLLTLAVIVATSYAGIPWYMSSAVALALFFL